MRTRNRYDKSHGYQWAWHFVRTVNIIHNIPHIYLIIEIATPFCLDHIWSCTQLYTAQFISFLWLLFIAAVVLLQKNPCTTDTDDFLSQIWMLLDYPSNLPLIFVMILKAINYYVAKKKTKMISFKIQTLITSL